jgi:hypothetical protein
MPGETPGLDTICDGILRKTPFIHSDKAAKTPEVVTS